MRASSLPGTFLAIVVGVVSTGCGGRVALYANVSDAGGSGGGSGTAGAAGAVVQPVDPHLLDVNAVWPGAGCGKPLPAEQSPTVVGSPKGYTHFTVMGTGANLTDTPLAAKAGPRTFWVRVPANYDPNRPYRVVYVGQGCGGVEMANTAALPLYKESYGGSEQAIYVALDIPEDRANQDCYDNRDGLQSQEWEAFQLFQEFVDAHYCVDLNRIYVAGYSTGGYLANMWGCYFAGAPTPPRKFAPRYHVRGEAVHSGGEPSPQPACGGPVAAIWIHDVNDNTNLLAGDVAALARVGQMNGCDTNLDDASIQAPWHAEVPAIGDVCKKFTGCPAHYPVVFCKTSGFGGFPQQERAIPAFKLFFDELNAVPTECVPECTLGFPRCTAIGDGLRPCVLDAKGCPVLGDAAACRPNSLCCETCGPTNFCL